VITRRTRKRVRGVLGLALAAAAVLCARPGLVEADEIHGPLAIRHQSPIHLLFFQFVPERAVPLGDRQVRLRVDVAETNSLTRQVGRAGLQGRLDLEMTHANLQARLGLGPDWEVGMDLPIIATHGGFMDAFVDKFETFIDYERILRRKERRLNTENEFTYRVTRNDTTVLRGVEDRVGVGDLAIQAKWAAPQFRETETGPAAALRMALKLPTGDPDAALGSGRPDLAFGAALEKTLGRWSLYANLNVTVPIGDRFSGPHLTVHPIFSGLLGAEYRLTPTLALVGHVSANSPPFRNTRMDFFDDWTDWCVLGLSWAPTPRWQLQGGLMENLITSADAGADFGVFVSAAYRFSL